MLLAAYDYTIDFISNKDNVYANFLSRTPINSEPSPTEQVTVNIMFIEGVQIVNALMVAMETQKDPILSKVLHFAQHGWPEKPEPAFQPYYSGRLDLSHEDGILLWNSRVVIPESLRSLLLRDLGMVKMKQLARKYL